MPNQVTIHPSHHVFTVQDDETILEAALREGYVIPYGCRNGACGSCKGKVLQGRVDYGKYQEAALSETEMRAGLALFCQAKPLGEVAIDCREISAIKDIPIRALPCRVHKMRLAAPDIMVIELKLPASERLQFLAGQYVSLMLKDGTRRDLSMANAPHNDEFLEFNLRNYGGPFSTHAFNRMKERDILRFEGPFGTFFLREDSDKPIVFLASGTGFAPIRAMVEHALHKHCTRPMALYWGGRVRADIYMPDVPRRWCEQHAKFKFVPVLSEALASDQWDGRTGLVHEAVMLDLPDLSGYQVYACGAPVMVEAARRDFTSRSGLPAEEFYADSFTPAVPAS